MSDNTPVSATGGHNRDVAIGEAVTLFFRNYFNFQGRSSRGAYWWWVLVSFIVSLVLTFIDTQFFGQDVSILQSLFSLATLIPGIALGVRRLHDIGRTGLWFLLVFTIIGILLLIYWYCQPGERKENAYGPDIEAGRTA